MRALRPLCSDHFHAAPFLLSAPDHCHRNLCAGAFAPTQIAHVARSWTVDGASLSQSGISGPANSTPAVEDAGENAGRETRSSYLASRKNLFQPVAALSHSCSGIKGSNRQRALCLAFTQPSASATTWLEQRQPIPADAGTCLIQAGADRRTSKGLVAIVLQLNRFVFNRMYYWQQKSKEQT